jgi:hypothetical protein
MRTRTRLALVVLLLASSLALSAAEPPQGAETR